MDAVRGADGLVEAEAIRLEQEVGGWQLAGGLSGLARQGDMGAIALFAVSQPEFLAVAAQGPGQDGQLVWPLPGPHPGRLGPLEPAGLIQGDGEGGAVLALGGRDQAGLCALVGLPEKGQGQVQVAFGHRLAGP